MITLYRDIFQSPCGPLSLVFNDDNILLHLDFPDQTGERETRLLTKRFREFQFVEKTFAHKDALGHYFDGDMNALNSIPCKLQGTPFQLSVWKALQTIAPGSTLSYKQLAEKLGNPKAVRAVARANALNPISLIYPCHRVIGSDGTLTGYAGGLERKAWLLEHEGAQFAL